MWGGGRGVVILGIVVTLRVVWWWRDCDCVLGPHGVVFRCDLNGVVVNGVGCWVRVIMVCCSYFDCDFLGCICLMRVFVVKRVL